MIDIKSVLQKKISLSINEIGGNLKEVLKSKIEYKYTGKCIEEGFVNSESVKIINYSSGKVCDNTIQYIVTFECMLCNPVEGQQLKCKVSAITKAGIRGDIEPLVVFVARDHHTMGEQFNSVKEGDTISVKVIGKHYELNDENIYCIASLIYEDDRENENQPKMKKKIRIIDNED
jgi:DNA-directed RNA polymerase subunit E'/Rpb7